MKYVDYDRIYLKVLDLGSDYLTRFGGNYQGGIYLQQDPDEITQLLYFLMEQNREYENYLEIGSASGGSAYIINYYIEPKNIILVDDNNHPRAHLRPKVLEGINRKEIIGKSYSPDVLNEVKKTELLFDIIFIDGDHSYAGVKKDLLTYSPLLKDGGYLILHDISEKGTGVRILADEMERGLFGFKLVKRIVKIENRLGIGVYSK